jgi:hypothetical protein
LLHLYKARLALACNNHKAAKKEVGGRGRHVVSWPFPLPCFDSWQPACVPVVGPVSGVHKHVHALSVGGQHQHTRAHTHFGAACATVQVRGLLSCDPDSPAALLLKAQLETCRQQPKKALKTLGLLLTAQHQHTIRYDTAGGPTAATGTVLELLS